MQHIISIEAKEYL